jgi:tRNA (guanosine-2'-O-)-methyltransferase
VKRDHIDAVEPGPPPPFAAPPEEIVRVLSPMVTPARLARIDQVISKRTRSLVPVLENLADPHNGAAVLRSADAFGCHEVHAIEEPYPFVVSHRVSRGTYRWLEIVRHRTAVDCAAHLAARGYAIYVAAMDGEVTPEELARVPKAAVVFGNEHKGVSEVLRNAAAGAYSIPMVGFVESLNVSVACAITLHAASRARHGDLDESERCAIRARLLMSQVRDADRIVREALER